MPRKFASKNKKTRLREMMALKRLAKGGNVIPDNSPCKPVERKADWRCGCGKTFASREKLRGHLKTCKQTAEALSLASDEALPQLLETSAEPSKVGCISAQMAQESPRRTIASPIVSARTKKEPDKVVDSCVGLRSLNFAKKDMNVTEKRDARIVRAKVLAKRARYNNRLADVNYGRSLCFFALMTSCFPMIKKDLLEGVEDVLQKKKGAVLGEKTYKQYRCLARFVDDSTELGINVEFFSRSPDGIPPALARNCFVVMGVDNARITTDDDSTYISVNDRSSWAIFNEDGNVSKGYRWCMSSKYNKYLGVMLAKAVSYKALKPASPSELYVYDDASLCPTLEEIQTGKEREEYIDNISTLNESQRLVLETLTKSIKRRRSGLFFIDGPAGSGKSKIARAFMSFCHLANPLDRVSVSVVASTGMAASLYHGGRTVHSLFSIPLNAYGEIECKISEGSPNEAKLKSTQVLIWDECVSSEKSIIEAVDKSLKRIHGNSKPFGGLFVVFVGDFRQTLPFNVNKQVEIQTIKDAYFWESVKRLKLTSNMRSKSQPFSSFLEKIGSGEARDIVMTERVLNTLDELIEAVFPNIVTEYAKGVYENRAILSPKNIYVNEVNDRILSRMKSEETVTYTAQVTPARNAFPIKNARNELLVKVGCPYMILKNLMYGVYNGTRGVCTEAKENHIKLRITTGNKKGEIVIIHRVQVSSTRLQFPITPCFAITINKSQGQTLDVVGLDFRSPVFAHGQLYVALSRVGSFEQVYVLSKSRSIINVVKKEMLE